MKQKKRKAKQELTVPSIQVLGELNWLNLNRTLESCRGIWMERPEGINGRKRKAGEEKTSRAEKVRSTSENKFSRSLPHSGVEWSSSTHRGCRPATKSPPVTEPLPPPQPTVAWRHWLASPNCRQTRTRDASVLLLAAPPRRCRCSRCRRLGSPQFPKKPPFWYYQG